MHDVELADIQGNILRGYNQPLFRYLCFAITDPVHGQQFLARLLPRITTAEPWTDRKPRWTVNVAFTANGLSAMGLPDEVTTVFPFEFRAGMKARAQVLVDVGESDPSQWESHWRDGRVHLMVSMAAESIAERDNGTTWVQDAHADLSGVALVVTQDAGKLVIDNATSPKEHFGYTDGLGNPAIDGVPGRHESGGGKMQDDGTWRPLAAGEFILGYRDEAEEISATPRPERLFRNGTFMVFRKLAQRVREFRRYVAAEGSAYPGGVELFKAKLVGRWSDGTPLMLSPNHPDPAIVSDTSRVLNFKYSDDPDGLKCPIGAHIRRANPRDTNGFAGRLSNRHRIIRRGIAYGPWLPPGTDDAAVDSNDERGLIFIAFNASIERQFEFVQQQWMNFGNDFRLGNDKDPLIGNRASTDKMIVQGDVTGPPPWITSDLPTFVVTRGGDYFFTPSVSGCRLLARAEAEIDPSSIADPEPEQPAMTEPTSALHALAERIHDGLLSIPGGEAIDDALHVVAGDLEAFGAKVKAWASEQNAEPVFAVLRAIKPILVLKSMAIVTKSADAQEVLSYPTLFTVPYGPKFAELCDGGGFFLGWDDTVQYTRDMAAMRLVVRREDIESRIAPFVTRTANAIVAKAPGRIDVVNDLGNIVPTEFVRDYMVPLVGDDATLSSQTADISAYLFLPEGDFRESALAGAVSIRETLSAQIALRKTARGVVDDVLERCLVLQDAKAAGMDDASILNNLFGMVVGAIPTTSAAVARAIDELLRRPDELAGAQAAARAGDTTLVASYVYEAMRFNPLGPGVFRIAQRDFEVAGGTSRATVIPAGHNVLVALQSASFDSDRVQSPDEFRIDRPMPEYLHFGFGLHTCFGRYINAVQIPRIVQSLLVTKNLRRAEGKDGTLQVNGPFPSRLIVEFDQ